MVCNLVYTIEYHLKINYAKYINFHLSISKICFSCCFLFPLVPLSNYLSLYNLVLYLTCTIPSYWSTYFGHRSDFRDPDDSLKKNKKQKQTHPQPHLSPPTSSSTYRFGLDPTHMVLIVFFVYFNLHIRVIGFLARQRNMKYESINWNNQVQVWKGWLCTFIKTSEEKKTQKTWRQFLAG